MALFFFWCPETGRQNDALEVFEGLRARGMRVTDLSSNELAKVSESERAVSYTHLTLPTNREV